MVYTIKQADLVALAPRVAHRSTVCVEVDGSHRAGYMQQRHGVTVEQADEALADADRLVLDPDYASRSDRSVRTSGWSAGAGRLVTDTTVTDGGVVYGVSGWPAHDVVPVATNMTNEQETAMSSDPTELERLIDPERGVPASALVRGWIVQRLAAEHDASTDTAAMVDRLDADVRTLRKFVAS